MATPSPVWLFVAALTFRCKCARTKPSDGVQNHDAKDAKGVPYNAVRSLSKLFGDVVALIDNEVLIENLEDFAALEVCHIGAVSSIVARKC